MFCNQFVQFFLQIRGQALYMRKDLVFIEDIKYLADRRAYKRISTVSGSMIAWLQGCFL